MFTTKLTSLELAANL